MKFLPQLRSTLLSLAATACGLLLVAASATAGEAVICKEKGSKFSYKIDVDWQSSTATISQKIGSGQWQKLFERATAVRNNAGDAAMLVEGTGKEWKGGFNGKCGRFIDVLSFDIGAKGGQRAGTVNRTPAWVHSKSGDKCSSGVPAPELQSSQMSITCS